MCEAKAATIILPLAFANSSWNAAPTVLSEGVYPSTSEFVESARRRSTPFSPICASLARSVPSPSTGVRSILKSPVCTIIPAGVYIANAAESAILWFVLINSILKHPRFIAWPYFITFLLVLFRWAVIWMDIYQIQKKMK